MNTEWSDDYRTNSKVIFTQIAKTELYAKMPEAIFKEAVRQVATLIAQHVMEEKGQEIIKSISPEAIANMAIAEAGAAVNETLHKKLPDKILRVENNSKEVWQRGFFGGLRRID